MPTTSPDRFFRDVSLTPRVSALKDVYFEAVPEVCIERARLVTEYHVDHGLLGGEQVLTEVVDRRAWRSPNAWMGEFVQATRPACRGCQVFRLHDNRRE